MGPWDARVFAGTYIATENVLRIGETMLTALVDAGADLELAANTVFHIGYYVMGFVIEEQAVCDDKIDMVQRAESLLALAKERFPKTHNAAHVLFKPDFDARFTVGVDLLLTGIEQRLPEPPQSRPQRSGKR